VLISEIYSHLEKNQYTWLITGVAGFIGSNLLEKLLKLNQRVIGVDNFSTGYKSNIDFAINDSSENCSYDPTDLFILFEDDITSCIDFEKFFKFKKNNQEFPVDFVLHQAALGSIPRSIDNPINTNNTNISGFLNILNSSREFKVKSFVYASSSSTYGDHKTLPKKEDRIGKPLNPYSVTKLVNEIYADVFFKTYGFNTIGLRYFNVFGKRQNPNGDYAAVIPKWISSIHSNSDLYINGDGETSRDFCYIENAIQMNILAATTKNKLAQNQVYNVAVGNNTSLNDLLKMILRDMNSLTNVLFDNQPIYREFRKGDIRHSLADISKAQTLLKYYPEFDISLGVKLTVEWYMKNINFIRKIS